MKKPVNEKLGESMQGHESKGPQEEASPPASPPIGMSEIGPKLTRFLKPLIGPHINDPEVKRMLYKKEMYLALQKIMYPMIQKTPRLLKYKDQADYGNAFPQLKGQQRAASSKPWSIRESQSEPKAVPATEPPKEYFGVSEARHLAGTPSVDIEGDKVLTFPDIPGVEGKINLGLTVRAIAEAMTAAFGPEFWSKTTNITVGPLPGKFGEARSIDPHTIYINPDAMINSVHSAVVKEAEKASSAMGDALALSITPEVERKIRIEVAKDLWETLGHERQHGLDFQEVEKKIMETGQGSLSEVSEAHGEQAGQDARSRFRMNL